MRGGGIGELRYTDDEKKAAAFLPSELWQQNCWMGVSQPSMADARAMDEIGVDRFMWGSDYPHDEGTYPHSREAIRSRFHQLDAETKYKILGKNCADLYGFDMDKLAPLAAQVGPTVEELSAAVDRDAGEPVSQGLARGIKGGGIHISDDMDLAAL